MQLGDALPLTTGLRAQFFIPVHSHIFQPGGSADRFDLVSVQEEIPSTFPVVSNCDSQCVMKKCYQWEKVLGQMHGPSFALSAVMPSSKARSNNDG